ncbi:PilW family protein [Shewanella sp. 202IG2-18]|uniref:PilW family protein n=1 Tax=Parashewanella hymeniacidonis TaxID=2807618 RepID=UPI001960A72F|nr:PilW family protein [Parashewanella hymeniacidonis]MBM7071563.1 PilW family protein [Parashewanella hymeniacidonis]
MISSNSKSGFSLVELMIAMVISLILTLGLFTMFRMSSTNVTTTAHFNELQENGRIALTLMERDISQAGFMGYVTTGDISYRVFGSDGEPLAADNNVESDCIGEGLNNGSLPDVGPYRTIWGTTVAARAMMNCFTDGNGPDLNTDVLQIKRAIGRQVNGVLDFANQNRHFFSTNGAEAVFYRGGNGNLGRPADLDNSYRDWDFAHHVYYIRSDNGVPSLRRRVLVNNNMDARGSQHHLVEGIENMRFLYGVDTAGGIEPEAFVPATSVPNAVWDNEPKLDVSDSQQKVVAIKVFLLVRTVEEDPSYKNDIRYNFGDLKGDDNALGPFNDGFRRKVLSTTIALDNVSVID